MEKALTEAKALGGKVHGGGRIDRALPSAYYVAPALVEMPQQQGPVLHETFAAMAGYGKPVEHRLQRIA